MTHIPNIYVGFDFSMNKPAATIYCEKKIYFYLWAANLQASKIEKYKNCNVRAISRDLSPVETKSRNKKSSIENTQIVLIHTIRSLDLANMIINDIDSLIKNSLGYETFNLYVCSEGLSYNSIGDATLNLATYKGVLLAKIYEHYGDMLKRLFTYSPITLKSTAGCATKELRHDKKNMILAFTREPYDIPFKSAIINGELTSKVNYIDGVDDLVDSYWAFQTMIKREKLPL